MGFQTELTDYAEQMLAAANAAQTEADRLRLREEASGAVAYLRFLSIDFEAIFLELRSVMATADDGKRFRIRGRVQQIVAALLKDHQTIRANKLSATEEKILEVVRAALLASSEPVVPSGRVVHAKSHVSH